MSILQTVQRLRHRELAPLAVLPSAGFGRLLQRVDDVEVDNDNDHGLARVSYRLLVSCVCR